MAEPHGEEIGRIVRFFAQPLVAVVELTASVQIGDVIRIKGHTTDLQQTVESLEMDHAKVQEACAGASVALKVNDRCRTHDIVYKLVQ